MAMTHGMDVAEVEALGRFLRSRGDSLRAIAAEVDRMVYMTSWEGDDSARFLRDWPTTRARLVAAAEHIRGLGQSALNNASEQREASNAGPISWAGGRAAGGRGGPSMVDRFDGGMTRYGLVAGVASLSWSGMSLAQALKKGRLGTGGILDLMTLPSDSYELGKAIGAGDVDSSIRRGLDVAWTTVGYEVPVVGMGKAAWDVGWFVGEVIGERTGLDHALGDAAVGSHIQRVAGSDGQLTPGQSAELGRRYDGWSGFGNFVQDSGRAGIDRLRSLF